MNLQIRNVEKEDINIIKDIIATTWNAEQFIDNEETAKAAITMMFISPILNKSTFGKVAILDNEVVGVIFGSRSNQPLIYKTLLEDYTNELIEIMSLSDEERQIFIHLVTQTNDAYVKLIAGKENEFQGCLEFFALTEEARGKQIGKKLLHEFISYERESNAHKIYVYTDTMSNYGFYEHMGFVRRGEEEAIFKLPEGEFKNTNFIYEYML